MLRGKAEVSIDTEGESSEGDKNELKDDNNTNNDQEESVAADSFEDIELNKRKSTSSWSFLQLMKLNTCIMTKVLKMKVKCLENILNSR